MEDNKFYSLITFIFGIIGFLCSVIMVILLSISVNLNIKFGNTPYIYCSGIVMLCFICNRYLYKKGEQSKIATIGSLFGVLSMIPIVLFFIILFVVLFLGPFLVNYNPPVYN